MSSLGTDTSEQPGSRPPTSMSIKGVHDSRTLENCTEVILLAMQVEMTSKIKKCLEKVDAGSKEVLKELYDKVVATLESAAIMLKGIEGQSKLQGEEDEEGAEQEEPER